jgi:hypothetical protein
MALKLCNGCERHVRESDAACPYCGSADTSPVPAPARVNRKAMYFAAIVLTTAAVETVSCSAVYGATIDCEETDCGYFARCRSVPTLGVGSGNWSSQVACSEDSYRAITHACLPDVQSSACSNEANLRASCAQCLLGTRGAERSEVPPGALLAVDPFLPNTGACASIVLKRPECADLLTEYDSTVASYCNCSDPGSTSACQADRRSAIQGLSKYGCLELRDARRAEWEPLCVGATPRETLDKVAHVLCFGR